MYAIDNDIFDKRSVDELLGQRQNMHKILAIACSDAPILAHVRGIPFLTTEGKQQLLQTTYWFVREDHADRVESALELLIMPSLR